MLGLDLVQWITLAYGLVVFGTYPVFRKWQADAPELREKLGTSRALTPWQVAIYSAVTWPVMVPWWLIELRRGRRSK